MQAESRRATDQAVDDRRHHLALNDRQREPTTHVNVLEEPAHPIREAEVSELNPRDARNGSQALRHQAFKEAW